MRYLQLFVFGLFLLMTGCSRQEVKIARLADLGGGKTFALPTGTAADQFVLKKFPDAKIKYFNTVLDCALAVKEGKADAAAYDKPILQNIAAKNEGLTVLNELLIDDQYGFAVQLENKELKNVIDGVLAELKSNGTYGDMMKRWFPKKGNPAPMPDIKLDGANGVLHFGTAVVTEPMSFVDANHKTVGFDIEFATYVAKKLGKQLEVVSMEFGAMLPALIAGKVDMIGAGLSITEERAKKVLFSESYYPSGIAVIVRGVSPVVVAATTTKMKSIDDIKDKRIGVLLGSIHDAYVIKTFPNASIFQYNDIPDLLMALNSEKIDVAFSNYLSLPEILKANNQLGILVPKVFAIGIAAGFNQDNDQLRERFNVFLQEIKSNGIYNDMYSRWMDKGLIDMPEIKSANGNGQLKVGVVSDLGMPSSLIKNGELVGFDTELAKHFAAFLGKEFVPVDMPFGSTLAAVSTKKVDLIICSLTITEERKKQIDFSEPYYETGVSVIAKKKNLASSGGEKFKPVKASFLKSVSDSFYSNMILENRYLLILDGLKVTIIISVLSALFGTLIGGLICFMRMSKNKILSIAASLFIALIRGTPVLVLLLIIFYVIFASVNINPVVVAVIAFGVNFGAYVSEMFRTSIESVDKGQKEAGIASGFTRAQTFVHIVMPQALRHVLPVYKGEFISMLKATSIVGYIAVQDLTKASDIIRSRTFDAFFPLIMAALLYIILAGLLTWVLGYVEVSVDPKRRHLKKEMKIGV